MLNMLFYDTRYLPKENIVYLLMNSSLKHCFQLLITTNPNNIISTMRQQATIWEHPSLLIKPH